MKDARINLRFKNRWRACAVALAAAGLPLSAPGSLQTLRWYESGGMPWVALSDMARLYGLRMNAAASDRIVLSSKYHSMLLQPDGRKVSLMDVQVWLQHPVTRARGRWAVHRTDSDSLLDPILRPYLYLRNQGGTVVVLDAGHGGKDGGAVSAGGVAEKDLTLDLVRRVRREVARDDDLRVYLTRDNDVFLELDDRSRLATQWKADLFVSIHMNSSPDPSSKGIETYIVSKAGAPATNAQDQRPSTRYSAQGGNSFDAASSVLGFHLQKRLVRGTQQEDRGLRNARFVVLKDAPCAAALVECGFLSNYGEARRFSDAAQLDATAAAIARGISDYVNQVRKAQIALP